MFDLIKAPHDAQLIGFCDSAAGRSPLFSLGNFLVNLTIVTDLEKKIPSIHRQVVFRATGNQLGCSQYHLAVAGGFVGKTQSAT
jgi:hypothetical protein